MELAQLAFFIVILAVVLLWAKLCKLDLALRPPVIKGVWPWILLFGVWCAVEWVLAAYLSIDVDPEHAARKAQLSLAEYLLVGVVLGPVLEELLFRGAMFSALLRRWGVAAAVVAPSLIWAALHVQYEAWAVISMMIGGILLAVIRWKSLSLYLPMGLHAAHNLPIVLTNHFLVDVF